MICSVIPNDYSIADMARDYGELMDEELGRVNVLGISMGGMIAQELPVSRLELVEHLVLANTGVRIDDVQAVDRFLQYAQEEDWASIRAELAAAMYSTYGRSRTLRSSGCSGDSFSRSPPPRRTYRLRWQRSESSTLPSGSIASNRRRSCLPKLTTHTFQNRSSD